MLRLSSGLHAALRDAARSADLSLNDFCVRKLALPSGNPTAMTGATAVVERAAELFGDALLAIVAYGSWTRDEAVAGSDVDVLIVVDAGAPITRSLYRRWDEKPPVCKSFLGQPNPDTGSSFAKKQCSIC